MATDIDDEDIVAQVSANLREKYPTVDGAEIDAAVRDELSKLAGRPVRDYLMVLTQRAAKKRIKP